MDFRFLYTCTCTLPAHMPEDVSSGEAASDENNTCIQESALDADDVAHRLVLEGVLKSNLFHHSTITVCTIVGD